MASRLILFLFQRFYARLTLATRAEKVRSALSTSSHASAAHTANDFTSTRGIRGLADCRVMFRRALAG
jgi:hypothetical protein